MNLLEAYKGRLAVSEKVYAKTHLGESMSDQKKLVTAKCLNNINLYLNEAFENSTGTQRSDLGMWKKFTMNLTTVALPNLIAYDLVIVQPMSSFTGYIAYVKYTAGSNKGTTKKGDIFNDPFRLGDVDVNYTSERVVETVVAEEPFADNTYVLAWGPAIKGVFEDKGEKYDVRVIKKGEQTPYFGTVNDKGQVHLSDSSQLKAGDRIAYVYDNVVIPQNDLPLLNAEMDGIALQAKARRIAVYYSQIAAFQAKNDYGIDLGAQLSEKAVGQLSYEIDTEITNLLIENAAESGDLVWSKTLPVGVSKQDHYAAFTEVLSTASQIIYDRTRKWSPNYMLAASNLKPILEFVPSFKAAPAGKINGPYFAGTVSNLKVFITPNIAPGKFVVGVNGDDMMSSAAVFAPYMPIVPTQLLGFADGGMSQGWSTLYDLKLLNKDLLVSGRVTA